MIKPEIIMLSNLKLSSFMTILKFAKLTVVLHRKPLVYFHSNLDYMERCIMNAWNVMTMDLGVPLELIGMEICTL